MQDNKKWTNSRFVCTSGRGFRQPDLLSDQGLYRWTRWGLRPDPVTGSRSHSPYELPLFWRSFRLWNWSHIGVEAWQLLKIHQKNQQSDHYTVAYWRSSKQHKLKVVKQAYHWSRCKAALITSHHETETHVYRPNRIKFIAYPNLLIGFQLLSSESYTILFLCTVSCVLNLVN